MLVTSTQLGYEFCLFHYSWVLSNLTFFSWTLSMIQMTLWYCLNCFTHSQWNNYGKNKFLKSLLISVIFLMFINMNIWIIKKILMNHHYERFYCNLKIGDITVKEYKHAKRVWNKFEIKKLWFFKIIIFTFEMIHYH